MVEYFSLRICNLPYSRFIAFNDKVLYKLEDLVIMFWLEQWLSVVSCDDLVCRSCRSIFVVICMF